MNLAFTIGISEELELECVTVVTDEAEAFTTTIAQDGRDIILDIGAVTDLYRALGLIAAESQYAQQGEPN